MSDNNPVIKWYSLTQLARASGRSYNFFKKYYLWQLPEPTSKTGPRQNWPVGVAEKYLEKIRTGEIEPMEKPIEDNA